MRLRPSVLLMVVLASGCARKHENLVHVIAEQAPGLKRDARVQFRGVDVGYVKEVYFTPGGVRIDALIERPDVPIRTQDTVRITTDGAFGEQVVSIIPGVQTAPLIHRGATLAKAVPDTTISVPVALWRSMVQSLGLSADSTSDTGIVVVTKDTVRLDSARKKPRP
jgi:ABC-type transporter Mla subunit MlaD